MSRIYILIFLVIGFLWSCSEDNSIVEPDPILEDVEDEFEENPNDNNEPTESQKDFKLLALGDSYTIGESVCETCRFPEQLKDSLINRFPDDNTFEVKVIAQTGWTTANLKSAINNANLNPDYDLVTLLIGVNNQFQSIPFQTFETEFNDLINSSIALGKGDKNNVIVISIFDYANTAFGQIFGGSQITEEITLYNTYIENYCITNGLNYIDAQNLISDTQSNPDLVASDGLHPSEYAYSILVEQLLPLTEIILTD